MAWLFRIAAVLCVVAAIDGAIGQILLPFGTQVFHSQSYIMKL